MAPPRRLVAFAAALLSTCGPTHLEVQLAARERCLARAEAVAIGRVERECPDLLAVCRGEGEILAELARARAACP